MTDAVRRRSLLALLGIGAAAGAVRSDGRAGEAGGRVTLLPAERPGVEARSLASLRALMAAPATPGARYVLDDGGLAETWRWREGDFRAAVAADPLRGLTLRHATVSAGDGAWTREWDGVRGRPEWFGARTNDAAFDNQPAVQAALDLCPTVELGAGSYHVRSGLRIVRNGTRLIGAGITQTDQGDNDRSTQIVCASATATILQIGADSHDQPHPLVETVQLRDFTVRRSVAPFIPATGMAGAVGIALRWCVNCHIERVFSIDSARGWLFYGTIENYVTQCAALRAIPGTRPERDMFIGFHLDYRAPLAANGGNASLYFDHCRAFGGFGRGTPALAYSAGLRTDGGWVDLFIDAFETGTLQYGIHGNGDGDGDGDRISLKTEDLIIANCVLDPGYLASIRLENAGRAAAVQIVNCYFAVSPSGTSIVLANIGGSVSLTGNQCITGEAGGTGLSAVNVTNLRATGNIYTRLKQPVYLERVAGFHVQDTIRSLDAPNDYPAITVAGCRRGKIDCIVSGSPGANSAGVAIRAGSSHIEVNCTNIDPAALAGGVARTVLFDGMPVCATGPFGAGCLATGIMG